MKKTTPVNICAKLSISKPFSAILPHEITDMVCRHSSPTSTLRTGTADRGCLGASLYTIKGAEKSIFPQAVGSTLDTSNNYRFSFALPSVIHVLVGEYGRQFLRKYLSTPVENAMFVSGKIESRASAVSPGTLLHIGIQSLHLNMMLLPPRSAHRVPLSEWSNGHGAWINGSGTSENHHLVCSQRRLQQANRASPTPQKNSEYRSEYQIKTHPKRAPVEQNTTRSLVFPWSQISSSEKENVDVMKNTSHQCFPKAK